MRRKKKEEEEKEKQQQHRASEIAQLAKADKPDNSGSTPGTHVVEGGNRSPQVVL